MSSRLFVVSPVLTAIAIGYSNPAQALIADRILPRVPVGGEAFKWIEYPLAEGLTVPSTEVGRRGRVNRVEFSGAERDSSTKDYGLEDSVPNSDVKAAAAQREQGLSSYDPVNRATAGLTNLVLLDRELRAAALVQDANNYAQRSRFALAGSAQFNDPNSDPIGVISEAIDSALVYRPNKATMGFSVWRKLRSHKKLINAVKGGLTQEGFITREQFAALFELQEVLIGESYINVSRKGQAVNLQRTWGNTISLNYIDPTARPEGGVTWGFTPQFGKRIAGTMQDSDVGLEGGVTIRIGEKLRELVVAKDAGAIIQNAVAL